MSRNRLWVASAIIIFLILIGFFLSVPHTRDVDIASPLESIPTPVPSVTLRDSFKKGIHTITGSIETPNACTTITAHVSLRGDTSHPNGIDVALSIPEDVGICLQVPTEASFSVTISAPAHLPITTTVNGVTATTTLP